MLKQKAKTILQSCVRTLAKWKATRTPVGELINYAFVFAAGWLVCYVTLSSLSPVILAVLGGIMAGAMIAPLGWLSVAILLHRVDRERQDNELAAIDAMRDRLDRLDVRYRESVLTRWQVGEDEAAIDQQ